MIWYVLQIFERVTKLLTLCILHFEVTKLILEVFVVANWLAKDWLLIMNLEDDPATINDVEVSIFSIKSCLPSQQLIQEAACSIVNRALTQNNK